MISNTNERHYLRAAIDAQLRTDQDLDAFCVDFFPAIYRRFGSGMERVAKVNLLFTMVEVQQIVDKLRLCAEPGHSVVARRNRLLWGLVVAAAVGGGRGREGP